MSIYIYQIGNVTLGVQASDLAGIAMELPRSFRGEAKQGLYSPTTYFTGGIQLPEPLEAKVSGTIFCRKCMSVADQFNALMSVSGRPYVDVIGYLPNPCCTLSGECETCGDCPPDTRPTWLWTTGFVKEVSRTHQYEEVGDLHAEEAMEIEIELILSTYWLPLNPYVWEPHYDGSYVDGFRTIQEDPYRNNFPEDVHQISHCGKREVLFNKKRYTDELALYDVDLWDSMFDIYTGVGHGWKEWQHYRVSPPIRRWSAPATSIYAFKGLTASGELEIAVESEVIPYEITEHISTLDLSELDSLLSTNGFTGIMDTDIVIATDSLYAPGFVVRNGSALKINNIPIKPVWTYEYSCVGELLGVNNRVTISTPSDVLSAHLHIYRML